MTDPAAAPTESMSASMNLDGDVEKLGAFYDQWANDYEADLTGHGYQLPSVMLQTLEAAAHRVAMPARRAEIAVLDAGCGTGLVGQTLHDAGWTNLAGIDLSNEMATMAAARGIYRTVEGGIDLAGPVLPHLVRSADVVTVGGVLTLGHVPPDALETIATMVRPGGLLITSTRKAYQETAGYTQINDRLVAAGTLELLSHTADAPYTLDSTGDYWAYRVLD